MLHLIPDDGAPHAPTGECGCYPYLKMVVHSGRVVTALAHNEVRDCELVGGDHGWTERAGTGES